MIVFKVSQIHVAHWATLISVSVALSLHCDTVDTELVHHVVCLLTSHSLGRCATW